MSSSAEDESYFGFEQRPSNRILSILWSLQKEGLLSHQLGDPDAPGWISAQQNSLRRLLLAHRQDGGRFAEVGAPELVRELKKLGPYQNPQHMYAFMRLWRQVIDTYAQAGMPISTEGLIIASTQMPQINALTITLKDPYEQLILFDDGMLSLCFNLGQFVADLNDAIGSWLPSAQSGKKMVPDVEQLLKLLDTQPSLVDQLLNAVFSFVITNESFSATLLAQRRRKWNPKGVLWGDAICSFVMAHELAHVYLKHNEHTERLDVGPVYGDMVEAFGERGVAELEADRLGSFVALNVLKERLPDEHAAFSGTFGASLYLAVAQIVEVAVATMLFERQERIIVSDIHPPADFRLSCVLNALLRRFESTVYTESAFAGASFMTLVTETLLQLVEREALRLVALGAKPHYTWNRDERHLIHRHWRGIDGWIPLQDCDGKRKESAAKDSSRR